MGPDGSDGGVGGVGGVVVAVGGPGSGFLPVVVLVTRQSPGTESPPWDGQLDVVVEPGVDAGVGVEALLWHPVVIPASTRTLITAVETTMR